MGAGTTMNKIPSIEEILSFDPFDTTMREYKGCQIHGAGDSQRIFVDFKDPDYFLGPIWSESFKIKPNITDIRLVVWKNLYSKDISKVRAIARMRLTVEPGKIPTSSLQALNQEQFFDFLQNYPDLMEWYLFNPFKILTGL